MSRYITKSVKETRQIAAKVAQIIQEIDLKDKRRATILALNGDLGSGKTVFVQGFAKKLKIKEPILSPTFIIFRKFKIQSDKFQSNKFDFLYHFDLYRIKDKQELGVLGFQKIIDNPQNIVLIEWAEKIRDILPPDTIFIDFNLIDKKTREIIIKNPKGF